MVKSQVETTTKETRFQTILYIDSIKPQKESFAPVVITSVKATVTTVMMEGQ